jgi:hypothetical protein
VKLSIMAIRMRRELQNGLLVSIVAIQANVLQAQTTDGFIGGFVRNSISGVRVSQVRIVCENSETNTRVSAVTGAFGTFGLPELPPGTYRIRADADNYQSLDIENLTLPVAGILDLDLRLRPSWDVWERDQYRSVFLPGSRTVLVFYGPDVDTSRSSTFEPPSTSVAHLDTSVSDVISPRLISELPLEGRDVYTAIVIEPGVASDTSTARGIGVTANGQRPSSSNFLLDGVENNNWLLSGPLLSLPPEAIQEFRVSTGNFSAEYGRTAGFIVNAVTQSGGSQWHGIGYADVNQAIFNANEFSRNAQGLGRLPFSQNEFGFRAGGPAPGPKRWLYFSTALDVLRSHGDQDAQTMLFPSPAVVNQAAVEDPTSFGVRLLRSFTPQYSDPIQAGDYIIGTVTPTTTIHRLLGLERLDIQPAQSKHKLSVRFAGGRMSEPDFFWSPYKGFSTPLDDRTANISAALRTAASPTVTNEVRGAWTYDNLALPRPHPEIPNLTTDDCAQPPQGPPVCGGVSLPQAGILYGYQNRYETGEFAENLTWVRGRQIFKFGGDVLFRRIGGYLGLGQNGALTFLNLNAFLHDSPLIVELGIDRLAFYNGVFQTTDFERDYHNSQLAFFAQDSVRLTTRLSVNFGVRYDNFGVPRNVGQTKDDLVQLGPGPGIANEIQAAKLVPGEGNEALFAASNLDWSGRFGFSYEIGPGGTVLRGGYGLFYDRSFDNLWENLALNNVRLEPGFLNGAPFSYSQPLIQSLAMASPGSTNYDRLFMYQPGFRTPYVHRAFFGLQRQLRRGMALEVNYAGSFGHELVTTDRINRAGSGAPTPNGAFNPSLPEILYRGNQGNSTYHAMTVEWSGSLRRVTYRLAYTWSHSIDNQSDPLAGEFDDLSPTNVSSSGRTTGVSAFAEQFASGLDRGNSDFDQRHDLVGMGFWELPGILRGWRVSGLGAIRSGLPYTVYAALGSPLYNARANLVDPSNWRADQSVNGGKRILNAAAFQVPAQGTLGNTGRNGFPGPGFFSVDASLSRSVHFRKLPEQVRLTFRTDLFNILNHVNLNDPTVALGPAGTNQNFGVATYGRVEEQDGSPVLTPFQETARQIHLILRLEF